MIDPVKLRQYGGRLVEVDDRLVVEMTDPNDGAQRRFRGGSQAYTGAMLKADPDARIITDEPERVCLALGLAYPDPQVIGG